MSNIRIDRTGPVGTITIDRTACFNSLDGAGGIFCSGADLKYIRGGGDEAELRYLTPETRTVPRGYGEVFKQILEYLHSTISEIRRAPKPFIAAVDGIAAAGGFGLAMACDIVVASERASFEWAYSRTGLTGAESSTFLLPRLIGLRRAFELMLLNPRLEPYRARDLGLITKVFRTVEFEDRLRQLAERLAAGPTSAYGIAKGLMNLAAGMDRLDQHLDRELDELARIANTPAFEEGLTAFVEKRVPDFVGTRD
jgi:2-(1,2-epoxy-1,2-dihydrophenyl)acetyl-CoA isomerase